VTSESGERGHGRAALGRVSDLADAGGRAGDEHDLAAEVLPPGEGPGDEAADEGEGEVDEQHQRQAHVHEAAQERVHYRLLGHLRRSWHLSRGAGSS
jgi:hypothetical protein